tara:strand:- start:2277 stop:2561 length:285 start_codon:yes stop_codon:yes gene_type:complete
MSDFESEVEIHEFLEQIDYALSSKFTEKWRHRFSPNFISIFQEYLLKAMKNRKPVKRSTIVSTYTKKHRYSEREVNEFFRNIDITLYCPAIKLD